MYLHIVRSFINVSNAKSFTILSPGGSSWEGPIRQYELLPGLTWNFTILDLQIDHGLSNSMLLKGLSRLVTICCKIAVGNCWKQQEKFPYFFNASLHHKSQEITGEIGSGLKTALKTPRSWKYNTQSQIFKNLKNKYLKFSLTRLADLSAAGPWPCPNDKATNELGLSSLFSGLKDWTADKGSLPDDSSKMIGLWLSASVKEALRSSAGTLELLAMTLIVKMLSRCTIYLICLI